MKERSFRILTTSTLVAALSLGQGPAMAETPVAGQVNLVRTHDGNSIPSWPAPMFWFTLKGVTAVENCGKFNNGEVLFVGRDQQTMLLALMALGKGLNLSVVVDAGDTANGFCVAKHVTVSKPT